MSNPLLKKPITPNLDADLNDLKFYKPSSGSKSTSQILAKMWDDSKERAMYDEILGPMLGNKNSNNGQNKPQSFNGKIATESGNTDFTTSILSRLKIVENEAKECRLKLDQQLSINENLRIENESIRIMMEDPSETIEEIRMLRDENSALRIKIQQMECFLGDYGLVWVGHKEVASNEDKENMVDLSTMENFAHSVGFAQFTYYINELNATIYSEPAQVIKEGQKARLVQASELLEKIRLVYYRNGLMVKRGPFRKCGSDSYKTFVKDIEDGYFPSEYKGDYPNGVVFDLKDKHDVDYVEGNTDDTENRMGKAQLLNRLPKTVIHKGEVIGIRNDINRLLHKDDPTVNASSVQTDRLYDNGINNVQQQHVNSRTASNSPVVNSSNDNNNNSSSKTKVYITTPAYSKFINGAVSNEKEGEEASSSVSLGKVVTIQIRWMMMLDQQQQSQHSITTLLAMMHEHDTVGDLHKYLQQHFTQQQNNSVADITSSTTSSSCCFELHSTYPFPRTLGVHLSLREAGLVPNGTVHARPI